MTRYAVLPRYSLGHVTLAPVPFGVTFLLMNHLMSLMASVLVATKLTFFGIYIY